MKAIVTTSKKEFDNYVEDNKLTDVKHVRILKDVQNNVFSEAILLKGAENVTDYVLNRITVSDGIITDTATTNTDGEYV